MSFLRITSLSVLIIFFFLIGGEFAKRNFFPYDAGLRKFIPDFFKIANKQSNIFCSREDTIKKTFEFFSNEKIENIFIGDSVVLGAHSSKLFKLNYEIIAVSGATIGCSKIILEYLNKIEPKNIIIYLGGNDADGQSNYDSNKASELFKTFVEDIEKINTVSKIYLIGINKGSPSRRNFNYVENLNKNIKILRDDTKVFYIESYDELNFEKKDFNQFSYDGEHLKYYGYKKWFSYLSRHIPNFKKE